MNFCRDCKAWKTDRHFNKLYPGQCYPCRNEERQERKNRKQEEKTQEQKLRWESNLEKTLPSPLTGREKYKATFLAKRAFNRRMDRLLLQWAAEKIE